MSGIGDGGKGFTFSLRFVSLFASAHVVLVLLQTNFVPLSDGWNLIWLGMELLLALGALMLSLGCYLAARSRRSDSLESFHHLFREILSPGMVLLLLWTAWAYIACFLAIREGRTTFYNNVRYLFYQTADLLVLFPLGVYYARRQDTRLLRILFDICFALFTLQLLYAFGRFFAGEATFSAFFGRGFDFTILRPVIGVNSNHTGGYAAFFLIAGIWRWQTLQSKSGRVLLALEGVVSFAALAMVESRGAILGLAAAAAMLGGALAWRKRQCPPVRRFLLSLLFAALACACCLTAIYAARTGLLAVQNNVLGHTRETTSAAASANSSTPNIAPAPGASGDQEIRGIVGKGASSLGGRKKIWQSVIRGAADDSHILFHGNSMASTSDWVTTVYGRPFRTHNQFLELLVAQGLPSLLLFLIWLFWLAGKCIRLGLDSDSRESWLLPLPLLLLLVHNMVEMMIVARPHVVCGFFYLIAGYVAGYAPDKKA